MNDTSGSMRVCPCAEKSPLQDAQTGLHCTDASCPHGPQGAPFPKVAGKPVLISAERCDTLCNPNSITSYVPRQGNGLIPRTVRAFEGSASETKANCERFLKELRSLNPSPRVLIIGSGTQGNGTEALYENTALQREGMDVYESPNVDCIADAHYLPYSDGCFDGVWIQAVLEHVVEPQRVVSEIHRVLCPDGLVYAETPFMQQVHEGAYDYTRFTVLGHRYLFRDFELIDMGGNKGADVGLTWSIRYYLWAITRSRLLSRAVALLLSPLIRAAGLLSDPRHMFDSSSGVYFFGRRSEQRLRHDALPSMYAGMQGKS